MKNYILEVCADSVESALSAKAGGATRLELCANLVIGGTTPGYELFEQVKKETGLPIRVLIRPRFGDFLYSEYEYQQMLCDVCHFAEAGADGVVIGSLNADGTLNEAQMRGLIQAAGDCGITLHRAFDVCADPFGTLQRAAELGVDTILTSGQEAGCMQGRELIRRLICATQDSRSDGRETAALPEGVTILVGAGVVSSNIREIALTTGAHAFHMSGKKLMDSGMRYRNERVHMGIEGLSEFELFRTDEEEIRRASRILQAIGEEETEESLGTGRKVGKE